MAIVEENREENLSQKDVIGTIFSFLPQKSIREVCTSDHRFPHAFLLYSFLSSRIIASLNEKQLTVALKNKKWSRDEALYRACRLGVYHVAKTILDKREKTPELIFPLSSFTRIGPNLVRSVCTNLGDRAFSTACKEGHLKIVKLLLTHDKILLSDNILANGLSISCGKGHVKMTRFLLTRQEPYKTNLGVACMRGHHEIVKLLLADKRVNLLEGDASSLGVAVHYGYYKIVKTLLDDERINQQNLHPKDIFRAINKNDTQTLNVLYNHSKTRLMVSLVAGIHSCRKRRQSSKK